MPKLISINGPTSSGKTSLSLELARSLPGSWIVNADSRQIYKRLVIGTGKEPGSWQEYEDFGTVYTIQDIPHMLIDYVDPTARYTLVDYVKDFKFFVERVDPEVVILIGGSGLYVDTLTTKSSLEITKKAFEEKANTFKNDLLNLSLEKLQELVLLSGLELNHSDFNNPRRLVNRIFDTHAARHGWLDTLEIPEFNEVHRFYVDIPLAELEANITTRLEKRYNQGLIDEVESLTDIGFTRLMELGLEYRLTTLYLIGQLTFNDYKSALLRENLKLAKRQITWLKKSGATPVRTTQEILAIINHTG